MFTNIQRIANQKELLKREKAIKGAMMDVYKIANLLQESLEKDSEGSMDVNLKFANI